MRKDGEVVTDGGRLGRRDHYMHRGILGWLPEQDKDITGRAARTQIKPKVQIFFLKRINSGDTQRAWLCHVLYDM